LRLDSLRQRSPHNFSVILTAAEMAEIVAGLDLKALDKARLTGTLKPVGKRDWDLVAQLGATVTQTCVVTLDPVRTRVDEQMSRRYRCTFEQASEGSEIEMPEDETLEPLPAEIDLLEVFEESLSLSIPAYPRADGAEIAEQNFAEPGITPMTDEDAKPFAGLAGLRQKLDGGEN
jgi:uncharacterized metal-binding protein YceD (DUF177 family)